MAMPQGGANPVAPRTSSDTLTTVGRELDEIEGRLSGMWGRIMNVADRIGGSIPRDASEAKGGANTPAPAAVVHRLRRGTSEINGLINSIEAELTRLENIVE